MKRSARMPATRLSGLATVAAISLTAIPWYAGAQELTTFQEGVSPAVGYAQDATYIRSSSLDGNFDDDTDLELIVGSTTGDVLRGLLEFDISEIPASSQIDSVSLELKTHTNTGLDQGGVEGNPTFNVYAYGFDIDELSSTWNDPDGDGSETTGDTMAGGTLGDLLTSVSFDVTATEQLITFANTPEFQAAVSAALADDGILRLITAKDDESTVGTHEFARFAADSSTTEGDRPALMVTYSASTDPSAIWPPRNDLGQRPAVPATTEGVVTIRNNGETKLLTLSNWAVSGPDADHVTVSDGPSEIAPGGTADLIYIFNSKNETGVFSATITFDSNDPNRPNAAIAISASVINSAGPDGHYTFDDGTVEAPSVNDITGHGRHGSVDSADGSVSFGQASLIGGAGQSASVDGGGAIEIPANSFDDLTDYTVSAWVQLSAFPAELGSIFAKSESPDNPSGALLVTPDGSLIWLVPDASPDPLFSTDPLLKLGEAAMVTVVSTGNGDNVSVYVNGALAASGQGLGEVVAEPGVFYIGSFGPLFTSGLVDDLQISAKALSAEEIKQLADNPGTVLVAEQADSDGDGLTDTEEIEAGTDPVKADTDGDGLGDFAEVREHLTNPLESDSDGDGSGDGTEVAAGSDPNDASSLSLSLNLVAYYPLDGNLQDIAGSSHGVGKTWTPGGKADQPELLADNPATELTFSEGAFGQGVDLDGSAAQYIETPIENEDIFDFGAPDNPTGFTVSVWYCVDSFTKDWQALVAKGEDNQWRVHRQGGDTERLVGNGGDGDIGHPGPGVNDGELHHVVLVSEPNVSHRFFIDGKLVQEGNAPNLEDNPMPMMIGQNPDTDDRTWDGLIDDVALWNRPLANDEIGILFNGGASLGQILTLDVGDPVIVPEITGVSISADGVALQLPAGTTYEIEYSADLVTWEVIASDVIGSYADDDAGRAGGETGYYRGVVK
ncbi:MAG: hypothetical protein ACI8T1_001663 [Verrucomicrobiales bacterium]|jgi:hypothetical protein